MPSSPVVFDFNNEVTLVHARGSFDEAVETNRLGAFCPCCKRVKAIRKRTLTAAMVGTLWQLHRWRQQHGAERFAFLPELLLGTKLNYGGDSAKLRFWGLVEQREGERDDGAPQTGYWRITDRGVDFVDGKIEVPSYMMTAPKSTVVSHSPHTITFRQAWEQHFNDEDMMTGAAITAAVKSAQNSNEDDDEDDSDEELLDRAGDEE